MRTIRITGTGSALPGRIVTNKELEQMVETSDEWIRERTGIRERHVSVGETVVTLASEAARKALEQAGKRAEEIDLILVATCSPEQYLPCCACQVQAAVGAVNALAFDVNAACSGFLFALNPARTMRSPRCSFPCLCSSSRSTGMEAEDRLPTPSRFVGNFSRSA